MSQKNKEATPRVERLRASLRPDSSGGFTPYAATMMANPLGGIPTKCTLVGHCRTLLFQFPQSEVSAETPPEPYIIFCGAGIKAAIVSDLRAYFENTKWRSLHFDIDVSLRAAVKTIHEKALNQAEPTYTQLHVVIEEYADFPSVALTDEQCFTIEEFRGSEAIIEGGRPGERALLAFPAMGCPWPDFKPDMYRVNLVLAAVKAAQSAVGHIQMHYQCSCFVSSDSEAVYTLNLTASAAVGLSISRLAPEELKEAAKRIESMLQQMMADTDPTAAEVFDAMVLGKSTDDEYLRLAYLRLWQAVEEARKHLGVPGLLNERGAIGGKLAPKKLKDYRNAIAHWDTGKIDRSYLSDLEQFVMELLRRKYGGNPASGE